MSERDREPPLVQRRFAPPARRRATVAGDPAYYLVAGEGDPIVFVHGLSGSGRWWMRNVPALSARYQLYLVDLPRFGSMRRQGRFVLAEVASWLSAWIDAVQLRRVHLFGHSMGGLVSIHLAAERPGTVSRLVLVAPAVLAPG